MMGGVWGIWEGEMGWAVCGCEGCAAAWDWGADSALAAREAAFRGPAEEGGGAPEGVADGLARQSGLVLLVPCHLPLLAAGW